MGDPRVQQVGVELAGAIRDFLVAPGIPATSDNFGVHIQRTLQPRLAELQQLRDEVIPAALRDPSNLHTGHWGVALDTQRMRVVKTFNHAWNFEFEMSRPQRTDGLSAVPRLLRDDSADSAFASTKNYGVAGGVVEQARVVLDQFHTVLGKFGIETEVPAWVTSLDDKPKPFSMELLHCMKDSLGDTAKSIMCPMKFASAAIDVFSGISSPAAPKPASVSSSSGVRSVLWRDLAHIR